MPADKGALFQAGVAHFNAGRFPAALECFERAAAIDRGRNGARGRVSPELRCFLAHSLHASGRTEEAIPLLKALCRREPGYPPAALSLAQLLRAGGRLAEAQRVLAAAARRFPRHPGARRLLLEVLRSRALEAREAGAQAEAERFWAGILERDPRCPEARRELEGARFKRALACKARGDWSQAARLLLPLSRSGLATEAVRGELEEALRNQALECQASGLPGQARRLWAKLLALRPGHGQARRELVALLRSQAQEEGRRARWAEARRILERVLRLTPEDGGVKEELARLLRERARRSEAEGAWRRARGFWARAETVRPRDYRERADRFRALAGRGRYREAFMEGERILDEDPTLFDLRAFWAPWDVSKLRRLAPVHVRILDRLLGAKATAWGYYYRGFLRGERGLEDFRRLERFSSRRYGWMQGRAGQTCLQMGRYDEAVRRLRRALRWRPADWRMHGYAAEALLCLGRREEAFREIDKAKESAPRDEVGQALAWRAALDLWSGQYEEAFHEADWACALGAPYAYGWRGAARLKLGDARGALRLLEEGLRLYPNDAEAKVWRGEAQRSLGLHRKALRGLDEGLGVWAGFNRALALAALKDGAGLRREFQALPASMIAYLARRLGLGRGPYGAKDMVKMLEAGLGLSGGYRRQEGYGNVLWMS